MKLTDLIIRRVIILTMFLVIITGPASTQAEAIGNTSPVKIGIFNVSTLPKTIDISGDLQAEIKYELSDDAGVSVDIYDADDHWVTSLKKNRPEKAGYNKAFWDGRNSMGKPVPGGAYIYVIKAEGKDGKTSVHDPADATAGISLKHRDLNFIEEEGRIEYKLPRAAHVRLRIGIKDGPLLRNLVVWEPREAGLNREKWNGSDEAGNPITGKPDLVASIAAFSLADNSIIVKSNGQGFDQESGIYSDSQKPKRIKRHVRGVALHPHAGHPRKNCHAPRFTIEFPEAAADKDGMPVLDGIMPMRVIIDEQDNKELIASRFEIMAFIDSIFLLEEEQRYSPFNYQWDTKGISDGVHILTVNIQSYDGHIGTGSLKVRIRGRE